MSDSFEELIRKRVEADREEQTADAEYRRARIQWWQLEVKKLFEEMEKCLEWVDDFLDVAG